MANYIIEVTYLGGLVMSRTTRFLKLFLPSDNDYYRVEQDQNENFEKIDRKLEEWDTGKEPAIKYKRTGFNLNKTDDYDQQDSNKLATGMALYRLWQTMKSMTGSIELTWDAIRNKPSKFPPENHNHDDRYAGRSHAHDDRYAGRSHTHDDRYVGRSHTHDDRYYTESETDGKIDSLAGKKDGTFPLNRAIRGNVYLLESTNKYYMCVKYYRSNYSISVPNENFIEMSVYKNLDRLNNLKRNWVLLYDKVVKCTGQKIRLNKDIKKFNMLYLIFSIEPYNFPLSGYDKMNAAIIPVIADKYNLCRIGIDLNGDDYAYAGIVSNTEIYVQGWAGTYLIAVYGIE